MKKLILKMSLGLVLFGGLTLPVQAATSQGQTTGQVSFYEGATTRLERQSLVIDQQIPNGETAIGDHLTTGHNQTTGQANQQLAATVSKANRQIPGWLKTTEARTTYWLVLGAMLLLVAGLLKLIQQTRAGEVASHVKR
ncbi:hypothetical protein ACFQH1_11610 [Lactiplantibacillus daoliensis]|uniref:Cell surface protein n=1 Tax=Lactiplantibacillus daoliensis TaxID=2559916 RepID=A0ABW1UIB0_9LACO|nr:hypothetical protein [Lactiplantibacillus daoliensis]